MIGTIALKQRGAPPVLQELDEKVHALEAVTEVEVSVEVIYLSNMFNRSL